MTRDDGLLLPMPVLLDVLPEVDDVPSGFTFVPPVRPPSRS